VREEGTGIAHPDTAITNQDLAPTITDLHLEILPIVVDRHPWNVVPLHAVQDTSIDHRRRECTTDLGILRVGRHPWIATLDQDSMKHREIIHRVRSIINLSLAEATKAEVADQDMEVSLGMDRVRATMETAERVDTADLRHPEEEHIVPTEEA
jgi:hypothetical protein